MGRDVAWQLVLRLDVCANTLVGAWAVWAVGEVVAELAARVPVCPGWLMLGRMGGDGPAVAVRSGFHPLGVWV